MDQLQTRLEALEQQMHTVNRRLRRWRGLAREDAPDKEKGEKGLAQRVAALEKLLKHVSREGKEIFITGANLHIVNGLGSTGCGSEEEPIPNCPNGLGNLIVGYNEPREIEPPNDEGTDNSGEDPNVRTGSHNVVGGESHNFSRFGGLVVGRFNTISGNFSVVNGGIGNTASNDFAAVSGGNNNTASGDSSAGSGGQSNTASGFAAAVSGGNANMASDTAAAVSGGIINTANNLGASVSGGNGLTVEQAGGWAGGSFGGEISGSFRSP
jgi:hypothetical protein